MSLLDREHTVAGPGYSRWLVPPAALAIHMCIGQVYGFSVFNLPLTRVLGVSKSAEGDWKLTSIALIFGVAIVFLGLAAAVFGTWLERVGPRKAMFAAACWSPRWESGCTSSRWCSAGTASSAASASDSVTSRRSRR